MRWSLDGLHLGMAGTQGVLWGADGGHHGGGKVPRFLRADSDEIVGDYALAGPVRHLAGRATAVAHLRTISPDAKALRRAVRRTTG